MGSIAPRLYYISSTYDASLVTKLIVILAAVYPALMAGRMNIIKAMWDRLKHIGFIFQFFNLFNELTAIENVMFPMMLN